MSVILSIAGVLICLVLLACGYFVPMLLGGIVGSFFGVAGFGGAVSGAVPGAIIGALLAKALK